MAATVLAIRSQKLELCPEKITCWEVDEMEECSFVASLKTELYIEGNRVISDPSAIRNRKFIFEN